jgi:hypothetical protein
VRRCGHSGSASSGEVRTFIGSHDRKGHQDGDADAARLCFPLAICYDIFSAHSGRPRLFVSDSHRVCAIYYQANADFQPPRAPCQPPLLRCVQSIVGTNYSFHATRKQSRVENQSVILPCFKKNSK